MIYTIHFRAGNAYEQFISLSLETAQDMAREKADKLMKRGKTIWWEGWRESILARPVFTEDGDYIWNGDRVRTERIHIRVDGTGDDRRITETLLGKSWRNFDNL